MTPRRNERALVRPHVVTGGRAHPTRNVFDLVTLVIATGDLPRTGLSPEKLRIIELCRGGALSVVEIAGHLRLPVGVTKVLLSDLVDSGHLTTRATPPTAQQSKARLLQEVLDGLRARL
ncbi:MULTISPECIES: DUF742 domain-containing protein [Actinomadura]|uniref:DUF742 domain-containing protein n=1 Tax=Actinomadura madurae TaxID=1993 RepID=A0A1I5J1N4_9ACTN|nr:DUF742 domain-containing protein [Actinomadura madurae]MCP9954061.1 DUF742 domain-containing protein [Actinomadura madurae]MCP9970806.1 DUF742 domain-containing protein [Actinomadura madurae]MCP9983284.1 DUF742 domain-containing protein [Actinomadura madurae]MCQ0005157.1 DUF742 domain-containing protein [Actinomadura madurae]MCQ0019532.1 DUF742 domain-containing protein [Actinomadura madurae]